VTAKIVYSHRVIQEIKSLLQNSNLSPRIDTTEIYQILKEGVRNGENKDIQEKHVLYIKNFTKK
jgi:hypothetical protein